MVVYAAAVINETKKLCLGVAFLEDSCESLYVQSLEEPTLDTKVKSVLVVVT